MTIKVGDKIPSMKLMQATAEGPKETSTDDFFAGKKVVLFAVPGAFTPTCSAKHLPGFVQNAAEFTAKGVDTVACIAVNDVFVMGAWARIRAPRARSKCWPTAPPPSPRRSAWNST